MATDQQKIAQLESLMNYKENEINYLQSSLKNLRKEYEQHLTDLSQKIRNLETKEAETAELRRNYGEKEHEMNLLRTKNAKLEQKIKEVLNSESEKIGQILNRNQALEKENLELYTVRTQLEESNRTLNSQISHLKNLNEAHEKHKAITKKNTTMLEEQIEKLTQELNEFRKKNLGDVTAKNEEINMLKFKVEEYSNRIETLNAELEAKGNIIKELGTNTALEQARSEIRNLEETKYNLQEQLAAVASERESLLSTQQSEKNKFERSVEEYEQAINILKKSLEEAQNNLREAQLENKKMEFEFENEQRIRTSIENFRIPLFHQDRLNELNEKYVESQANYVKAMEENKKLRAEIFKMKSETSQRVAELTKIQQNENKEDFALLINKLQMAINRNKVISDEVSDLKRHIEFQNGEARLLQDQIEKFISDIRTLTLENNTLKVKLNQYDPMLNLEYLSREEVDEVKDKEINDLRMKVRSLNHELQERSKTTVDSNQLNQLKLNYEMLNEELQDKNNMIEGLTNQLRVLRQACAINNLVSVSSSDERVRERAESIHEEQNQDMHRQITELVQKRFEFENIKQRLTQENAQLISENRELSKKLAEFQLKVNSLNNQNVEYGNKVTVLEKEKKLKMEAIANREKYLNEVILEQQKVRDERDQFAAKVAELEEQVERQVERVRYYEEYANRISQIQNNIVEDKELYLKTILNQKNEITLIERRHKAEIDKVMKEREELREQLVSVNNEKVNALKMYYEATFSSKLKLENQNILITNFLKKIAHQEAIISELDAKATEYMKLSQNDFENNIPKLSEISNILNKSRLSAEDYKNFEAIKELLLQQRTQYEESVKLLEGTIDTLGQRYFALEETYGNEKKNSLEQLDKLRKENIETIAKYENKIRELEEREKANLAKRVARTKTQPVKDTTTEGENTEMEIEEEGAGEEEEIGEGEENIEEEQGDLHAELESLRAELNTEREVRLRLESELEVERQRARRSEEEKANSVRRAAEVEKEKNNLCKLFTIQQTSWIEQKKANAGQIEEFRREDENRASMLVGLTEKLREFQNRQLQEEGGTQDEKDIQIQDLEIRIESLKNDNLVLKKVIEENTKQKKSEGAIEEEEVETEEAGQLREENNKLKEELEEVRAKVRILEDETSQISTEINQEDVNLLTEENEAEILELKKAFDSGSLLSVLEKAQILLLARSSKA